MYEQGTWLLLFKLISQIKFRWHNHALFYQHIVFLFNRKHVMKLELLIIFDFNLLILFSGRSEQGRWLHLPLDFVKNKRKKPFPSKCLGFLLVSPYFQTVLHKYWIIEMDQGGKNWFVGKKYKFCRVIKAAKHDSII